MDATEIYCLRRANVMQAEMAGSPDLAPILEMLNATRASARERQGEIERKIRAEARKLRQGDAAGARYSQDPQQDKLLLLDAAVL